MTTPLFSPYRQGENRVTSTFLAVLQRLSLPNMGRILGALLEDTAFNLVTFHNQPKGTKSTPDARIRTGPGILIETKTKRNDVRRKQITDHLQSLDNGERLLLLTPDDSKPMWLDDNRVIWSNFETLADAIEGEQGILNDLDEPPSEKEAFLLREFIRMLKNDRLIGSTEPRVLVVAARWAWPMYKPFGVYRCSTDKPMGSFRVGDYLAFYADGEIKRLVPKALAIVDSIDVTQQEEVQALDAPARDLAENLQKNIAIHKPQPPQNFDHPFKTVFLTAWDDPGTVKLPSPVINDKTGKNGKLVPFTYGQPRYVTLESLEKALKTSELARAE